MSNGSAIEIRKMEAEMMFKEKNIILAYLFWFFLGGLGIHRFYLGKTKSAVGMLALNVLGYLTLIVLIGYLLLFVFVIWWVVDAYLVYKITEEYNDEMKKSKMAYLKAGDIKEPIKETTRIINE